MSKDNANTVAPSDSMLINGVEYVRKDFLTPGYTGNKKIVVLQRGWVYIGDLERNGNDCTLHNAQNIRKWGTTKGLGQLVEGPTKDTVLDPAGTVEFDYLTVVATLTVNPSKW